MLEIKICEWGDNRLRLILAPIDSVYNAMQKPINDYFRPFDVTNIFKAGTVAEWSRALVQNLWSGRSRVRISAGEKFFLFRMAN